MPDTPFNQHQAAALRKTRLYWLAALLSQVPLPFVALPITGSDWLEQAPDGAAGQSMMFALLIGAAAIMGGLFTRNQVYKSHWQGDVIHPDGYCKANALFFAALTGGAFALFVLSIINRYPAPTFAAAPVFIGVMIFNYPSGKPMRPAPPRLGTDGERL